MIKAILVFLGLITLGEPYNRVDPAFLDYCKVFERVVGESIPSDLEISFDPSMEEKSTGYYHKGKHYIKINPKRWDKESNDFREMLILHELGHAVLRRKHVYPVFGVDGCPQSMMYFKITPACYAAHKVRYHKELPTKRNEFFRISLW